MYYYILTDENVFEHCTNLFGVVKLILLKVSVGAIVLQGLIESFLYSSGSSPYGDDDRLDAEEKTLRAYCTYMHTNKLFASLSLLLLITLSYFPLFVSVLYLFLLLLLLFFFVFLMLGVIVLLEFVIMSFIYYYAFGYKVIIPFGNIYCAMFHAMFCAQMVLLTLFYIFTKFY